MKYRELVSTGIEISEIVLRACPFTSPAVRDKMGAALHGVRGRIMISDIVGAADVLGRVPYLLHGATDLPRYRDKRKEFPSSKHD